MRAYKKTFIGEESSIVAQTDGQSLPEVHNLTVALNKKVGTTAKLAWLPPQDARKVDWEYGIYYALNAQDLFETTFITTKQLTIHVDDLLPCEQYIFSVGIVGPLGIGPISRDFKIVMTHVSPRAPPKDVIVTQDSSDASSMIVRWSASCPTLKSPIGYIVDIFDKTVNKTMKFYVNETANAQLSSSYKVNLGGIYNVSVFTSVADAIPSTAVEYHAPSIRPPHQVKVFPSENGSCIVFWNELEMPEAVKALHPVYVVLVNEGDHIDESTARKFRVDTSPFVLDNVTHGQRYTFAVYLRTAAGYRSPLSEEYGVQIPTETWAAIISKSNVVGIIVPLVLILLIVVAVLAFFIVKHRRLHQNFVRFASSHYDTRSGAATFGGDVLGMYILQPHSDTNFTQVKAINGSIIHRLPVVIQFFCTLITLRVRLDCK